jgi:ribosomal protein S18 acetylase RimI-like enzyme
MREQIRPLVSRDREAVRSIVDRAGNFTAEEVSTAMELVDEWLADGEASDYFVYVLTSEEDAGSEVRGYVCFGPTPLTDGTYDLYWIAVDAACQGRGYGRRLLEFAEDDVRHRGGRLLLIETSSKETYGSTIRFYERAGYELAARINDFYRVGDDKLVFAKTVTTDKSAQHHAE